MQTQGKSAIITGASGKLGSEIALCLAKMGFCCICHFYDNAEIAEQTASQIRELGADAYTLRADLTTSDGIEELICAIEGLNPAVLINSASIFEKTPLCRYDYGLAERIFSLNALAPIALSASFAKICSKDIAKIINIADVAASLAWAGFGSYCASKAAIISATKSLAKELAPKILVNAVSPGVVNFPDDFDKQEAANQIAKVPLARAANYDEITSVIELLIKNDYITGETITIDGGRCL